jgi:hypothetical protein
MYTLWQRAFVLERLNKIPAIDPSAARGALEQVLSRILSLAGPTMFAAGNLCHYCCRLERLYWRKACG